MGLYAGSYISAAGSKNVIYGDEDFLHKSVFLKNLSQINVNDFADKRVVIKGCGDKAVSEIAYVEITKLLRPVVKSIMYGEPCSTVPIYKQAKANKLVNKDKDQF